MKKYIVTEKQMEELNKLFFSLCKIEIGDRGLEHLDDCILFLDDWSKEVEENKIKEDI